MLRMNWNNDTIIDENLTSDENLIWSFTFNFTKLNIASLTGFGSKGLLGQKRNLLCLKNADTCTVFKVLDSMIKAEYFSAFITWRENIRHAQFNRKYNYITAKFIKALTDLILGNSVDPKAVFQSWQNDNDLWFNSRTEHTNLTRGALHTLRSVATLRYPCDEYWSVNHRVHR